MISYYFEVIILSATTISILKRQMPQRQGRHNRTSKISNITTNNIKQNTVDKQQLFITKVTGFRLDFSHHQTFVRYIQTVT